jgi:hypothetical protein
MSSKKKILIHSNHCRVRTGFGKHMLNLLTFLHKTKKYEIVEVANGRQINDPALATLPWKCIGSLPSDKNLIEEIKADASKRRLANYGHYTIDSIIAQEKPDIYLAIEDIWGVENFLKKKWWNKINSIIWTPIDSLPLLDKHYLAAKKTKNLIVQASFAYKKLQDEGFNNCHLLPVPLNTNNFQKLDADKKSLLRSQFNIDKDSFIIGFVFRNQLRKGVPNLLEGFKSFIANNPQSKAKLLLHTHWGEGWDISRLIKEKQIDPSLVLTTYFCPKCGKYEIKPFSGQNLDCRFCGSSKSQQTAQINRGVSESQLNEIYNLMDVYCHAFTSGGQEIPIQEAKLCELITLVTNYSCGEDYCSEESGGLPLDWAEYREPGTQFIKASTSSDDISSKITQVYNMSIKNRELMGKKARDFVINFCSIDSVCPKFQSIIDKMEKVDWDFDLSFVPHNVKYVPPEIVDHREWTIDVYKNILGVDIELENTEELNQVINKLNNNTSRQVIYNDLIKLALKENAKNIKVDFNDILDKDDVGKRILFCLPENEIDVFNSTSLLKFIKEEHSDHNIYFATKKEYFDLVLTNPYVHKVLEYNPIMEDTFWGEGALNHKGFFSFVLLPHINTHKFQNYRHSDKHKIPYDLKHA